MNWLFGWIKEKLGSSVCKMNFYVPVGTAKLFDWIHPKDGKEVTHYKKLAYRYFGEDEMFLKFRGGKVEVHAENEIYRDGKIRYFGINAMTGDPVGFHDTAGVVYSPKMLAEMFDVSDVKAARSIMSGIGGSWISYVIGAALGALAAYMVLSVLGIVDTSKLSGGLVMLFV